MVIVTLAAMHMRRSCSLSDITNITQRDNKDEAHKADAGSGAAELAASPLRSFGSSRPKKSTGCGLSASIYRLLDAKLKATPNPHERPLKSFDDAVLDFLLPGLPSEQVLGSVDACSFQVPTFAIQLDSSQPSILCGSLFMTNYRLIFIHSQFGGCKIISVPLLSILESRFDAERPTVRARPGRLSALSEHFP